MVFSSRVKLANYTVVLTLESKFLNSHGSYRMLRAQNSFHLHAEVKRDRNVAKSYTYNIRTVQNLQVKFDGRC
jgi:hypothetical protein